MKHTPEYLETQEVSFRNVIARKSDIPMMKKPMTTEAGPPDVKDPAEPMNKPEPIAPPLRRSQYDLEQLRPDLHSNELHVSTTQITV